MAKCKICGLEFQGDSEYCENCINDNQDYPNELNLDELLDNMVQPTSEEQVKENEEDILALTEEEQDNILALTEDEDVKEEGSAPSFQENSYEEGNSSNASDLDTMNEADDDLVALLSMITGLEESANENSKENVIALDETMDSWNQDSFKNTSVDEEVVKESQKNNAISKEEDTSTVIPQEDADKSPEDLGEIFSDSLSAIYSLNDQEKNIDFEETDTSLMSQPENKEEIKKEKRKKVFGDSKDMAEDIEEEIEKPKEKVKKSKKKKKDKSKGKELEASKDNPNEEETKANKKAIKEKKLKDKKEAKANKKNAKKENAKKKAETKKKKPVVTEDIEEIDTGKISKAGASFAFIFCALLATFIVVGANIYTYALNMKKAKLDFERKRYTDAYYEIYGHKIKADDIEIYDKIMTVMYVNKQLNSYYNYTGLNKKPEALDSLLKGLEKYEENIETAISLGIEKDMNDLKSQIIAELESNFNIKEKEALDIISTENQEEYAQYILNIVADNVN